MNITINVPDTAIKLQYCVVEDDGCEFWKPVTLGSYISVAKDSAKGDYQTYTCGDAGDYIGVTRGTEEKRDG